jgi:hypothetical protein
LCSEYIHKLAVDDVIGTHPNDGLVAAGTKAEAEAAQATKQNTVFIMVVL